MYQYQYDHLSEFYHLYRNLGGNGQAQEYFENTEAAIEGKKLILRR